MKFINQKSDEIEAITAGFIDGYISIAKITTVLSDATSLATSVSSLAARAPQLISNPNNDAETAKLAEKAVANLKEMGELTQAMLPKVKNCVL